MKTKHGTAKEAEGRTGRTSLIIRLSFLSHLSSSSQSLGEAPKQKQKASHALLKLWHTISQKKYKRQIISPPSDQLPPFPHLQNQNQSPGLPLKLYNFTVLILLDPKPPTLSLQLNLHGS